MINGRPLNEKWDFSVFSWDFPFLVKSLVSRRNLSFLARLLVSRKAPRFPFLLMAGHTHLMCRNLWPATWMIECLFGFSCGFSLLVRRLGSRWNLSFLGMSLRYFLLFCGRPPLLINSQVHSTNWLTLFLRENPKFSREEKPSVGRIFEAENSKRKECGREKRKENCSHFDFQ